MTNPSPVRVRLYRALRKVVPLPILRKGRDLYARANGLLRYGDPWFPWSISIEISQHCNRTCYYCPQSVERLPARHMEEATFHKAVERIKELNWTGNVDFARFNEPLLVINLESRVAYVRKHVPGACIQIITNGDFLSPLRLEFLLAAGVDTFSVSNHPPFSAEWEQNIRSLQSRYPGHIVWHTPENMPLGNRGGMVRPKIQEDLWKTGCTAPTYSQIIDINGDYLFCCCDYKREYRMGSVFDRSILDAWNSAPYRMARTAARKSVPVLEVCKRCFNPTGSR